MNENKQDEPAAVEFQLRCRDCGTVVTNDMPMRFIDGKDRHDPDACRIARKALTPEAK